MEVQLKAQVRLRSMTVEVEGETQKDLFKEVASAIEIFNEKKCGLCGCEDVTPAYRTVTQGKKSFEYPEWQCNAPGCRARLSLGCMMEGGGLFPIRKLDANGKPDRESGSYGQHNGWTKYRGEAKEK